MPMLIVEHKIDANNTNKPKLSLAVSTTLGEIRASVVSGGANATPIALFGRPSSPVYNTSSGAAALIETLLLDSANDAVLTLAILNNGTGDAAAKAEVAIYSGNRAEPLASVIDQAALAIPAGTAWTAHVLLKMIT